VERPLRILIHLDFLGLGGHMLSTISLAEAIKCRGHEVLIAGEMGSLRSKLEERDLPYAELALGLDPIPNAPVLAPPNEQLNITRLSRLAREWSADLVHAFHPFNLPTARRAALSSGIPAILTVCGGKPAYSLPAKQTETIVFSEELRDAYVRKRLVQEDRIHVVANRLPLGELMDRTWELEEELSSQLKPGSKRILMIGRLDGAKTTAALHVIEACALLRQKFSSLQLLLVGSGSGVGTVKMRAKKVGLTTEGGVFVHYGRVLDAYRFIPHADICVGVGRSIFEAMAIGRPCVIVGSEGYAGLVSPEAIEKIAYFNFSGRNARKREGVAVLSEACEEILGNERHARFLADFAQKYASRNLDAAVGAEKYEVIYEKLLRRWREGMIPRDDESSISRYAQALRKKEARQNLSGMPRRILRRVLPWSGRQ